MHMFEIACSLHSGVWRAGAHQNAHQEPYDCSVNTIRLDRITFNPLQCGGRPCVRRMRIRVADVLGMLANDVSEEQILTDFPDLQLDGIRACLRYAATR